MKRDGLTELNVAAYSVGHFFNDLCAVMWFMYLAWYLTQVVELSPEVTAASGLAGQICDGLATTIVGALSDKLNTPCGKRMPWFIFGTLLVFPSFMGIFIYPEFVVNGFTEHQKTIWYICLPGIFNIGWASVQIAHMVVVNDLSASNRRRDKLVNNRNGFTYAANILILVSALVLFEVLDSPVTQFRVLCLISVVVGSCTSLFYIFSTKENKLVQEAKDYDRAYKIALFGEVKEEVTKQ